MIGISQLPSTHALLGWLLGRCYTTQLGCGICHSRCWSNTWHLWRICRSFGLNFYWIWGSRLSNQSGKSWCGNHPWKWPIPQLHQEPRSATVKAFVMLIPIAILSLFVADPATWKSSLVCKMARRKLKQWEEMRRQHHDLWLMTCDIGDGNMQTGRQTAYIHRNVTIYICRWNDWVLIGLNFNWINLISGWYYIPTSPILVLLPRTCITGGEELVPADGWNGCVTHYNPCLHLSAWGEADVILVLQCFFTVASLVLLASMILHHINSTEFYVSL